MATLIREQWMWNRTPLRIFVSAFVFVSIVLAGAFYPVLGRQSLWLLCISIAGILSGIIYGQVGKKVRALYRSLSNEKGEVAESLIVTGAIQAPGITILRDDEVELVPIVGARTSVSLAGISHVREVKYFNGKLLLWKRGFWLTVPGKKRLGFAVADSIAARWREKLDRKSKAHEG